MMHQARNFAFAAGDGVKILELPYTGDAFAMTLVLPDNVDGLDAVEARLSPALLADWTRALTAHLVHVGLPRFESNPSAPLDLRAPLQAMGIVRAFDSHAADFSGMAAPQAERLSSTQRSIKLSSASTNRARKQRPRPEPSRYTGVEDQKFISSLLTDPFSSSSVMSARGSSSSWAASPTRPRGDPPSPACGPRLRCRAAHLPPILKFSIAGEGGAAVACGSMRPALLSFLGLAVLALAACEARAQGKAHAAHPPPQAVPPRLPVLLFAACVLVFARPAGAQPAPAPARTPVVVNYTVELDLDFGRGAGNCPSPPTLLHDEVRRRLGYDPFLADPQREPAGRYRGTIAVDPKAGSRSSSSASRSTARSCGPAPTTRAAWTGSRARGS